MKETVTCFGPFSFAEVMPCSRADSPKVNGHSDYKYELLHDGSERAYSSIIDLRKAKIENHLSISAYNGTRAFYPFRYEDLESNGTGLFVKLAQKRPQASNPIAKVVNQRALPNTKMCLKNLSAGRTSMSIGMWRLE
jgi:hypothetical protein